MSLDTVEDQALGAPLGEYVEQAYLDYAMTVVLDRALPRLGDGLKPVQRRILYAMAELGLRRGGFKKSARTVGDVIGKYHPHGDAACYEAMVLMAQPFASRYALIEGQGNWGSVDDPSSFAAMRYTEARLTPYADNLLEELHQGTTEWGLNFDGSLEEPLVLPSRLPHVLLNGASGIAIGMATDIPPHNMGELGAACRALLRKKSAGLDEILAAMPAPDFAGGGVIVSTPEEIRQCYATGRGTLRARAAWETEGDLLVIRQLPPQVPCNRVLGQIAQEITAKRLSGVLDLRDEGDEEQPVRLVLELKRGAGGTKAAMRHLFLHTDLEKTVKVNLNCILPSGKPKVCGLEEILRAWLEHRASVVRRRLEHRRQKVMERLHLLEGLLLAQRDLDRVIRIIREADKPRDELMAQCGLTEIQAEAILNLRLRQLGRLEREALIAEQGRLLPEREQLDKDLASDRRIQSIVSKEIGEFSRKYGDARRTRLDPVEAEAGAARPAEQAPKVQMDLWLSREGWVVATQRRGKATESKPDFRAGDGVLQSKRVHSRDRLAFLDTAGRLYGAEAWSLRSPKGDPLTRWFEPGPGASFVGFAHLADAQSDQLLLLSRNGRACLLPPSGAPAPRRSGRQAMAVQAEDALLKPQAMAASHTHLAVATSAGRLAVIARDDVPVRASGRGVRLLRLNDAARPRAAGGRSPEQRSLLPAGKPERLVAAVPLGAGDALLVRTKGRFRRFGPADLDAWRCARGKAPKPLPKGWTAVVDLEAENPGSPDA